MKSELDNVFKKLSNIRVGTFDIIILAALLLSIISILTCNSRIESYGSDSSYYIELSDSIAQKGKYEFNYIPHTKYPPGIPIILFISSLIFNSNSYTTFIRLIGLFGILGVVSSFFFIRYYDKKSAAIITIILLSSPYFFNLATRPVLSDLPYLFTSFMVLICSLLIDKNFINRKSGIYFILSFFLVLSILIRSVSVALFSGLIFWVIFSLCISIERGKKRLKTFLPFIILCFITLLSWNLWSINNRVYHYQGQYMDSYFESFFLKNPHIPDLGKATITDLLLRTKKNLSHIFADISRIIIHYGYISNIYYSPLVLLPFLFTIFGLISSIRKEGGDLAVWYFISYLAIYSIWPFNEGPRFILPIFPLAAFYFYRGVKTASIEYGKEPGKYNMYLLSFAILVFVLSFIDIYLNYPDRGKQSLISCFFWATCICFFLFKHQWNLDNLLKISNKISPISLEKKNLWILLAGIIVIFGYIQQYSIAYKNINPDPTTFNHYKSVEASKWIKKNLNSNEIIMAGQYAIIHRITKNKTIPFPVTENTEEIIDIIKEKNVDYLVVLDPTKYPYFLPQEKERLDKIIDKNAKLISFTHREKGFSIFRIINSKVKKKG
ncbi:MAG: ArnT family glycosyltransferase [bacterium]